MSDARLVDAAKAAVTAMNAGPAQAGFAQTFTAVRAYRPVYNLTAFKSALRVTVVPKAIDEKMLARLTVEADVAIDVAVQGFIDAASEVSECDSLMLLMQQIKTVLEKGLTLPEANLDCGWRETVNDPAFDPDHLKQFSVFTSIATLSYLTRRAR